MLAGLTESEYTDLMMSVGTHRRDRRLVPIRVAELLRQALEHSDLQKITDELQLADTTIPNRFLSLLNLAPEVQGLVSWGTGKGTLSFSVASEIARFQDPVGRSRLVQASLEHQLTRQEVVAI